MHRLCNPNPTSAAGMVAWFSQVAEEAGVLESKFPGGESANRLFYLAIPPSVFTAAAATVKASGCVSEERQQRACFSTPPPPQRGRLPLLAVLKCRRCVAIAVRLAVGQGVEPHRRRKALWPGFRVEPAALRRACEVLHGGSSEGGCARMVCNVCLGRTCASVSEGMRAR